VALYSAHAGWLLGHRFLLLRHRGRRSHRLYGTVLSKLAGFGDDGSDAARRRLVQSLPLVALRPRERVDTSRYDTAT
jgi:hypothetical protein